MGLDIASRARFNLSKASVLLLESTSLGMSILSQIVAGLGVKTVYRCANITEAQQIAQGHLIDLAIVDSLVEGQGYEFVHWLRRSAAEPNCFAPVLLTEGHTRAVDVARARDCGVHFIIKKPLAPITVLERIVWVSKAGRSFVYADDYVGPDRRFKDDPTIAREFRRRREDPASDVEADSAGADTSQQVA